VSAAKLNGATEPARSAGNGAWTDFIDEFMEYTENTPSPEIYRLWSAISMVAGALERRVWTVSGDNVDYANLYILLVGTPGTGKGVIRHVGELWQLAKEPTGGFAYSVAPDSATKAALVDQLMKSEKVRITKQGNLIYHALLVPAEEFEVLLPSYNPEFLSFLNSVWNNPLQHREIRRHGPAKDVEISCPFMHILGGVQPAWFVAHFPEEAWTTGFIRRIIMIYAESPPTQSPFKTNPKRTAIKEHIVQRLGHLSTLQGHLGWEMEGMRQVEEWHEAGYAPVPTHSRLAVGYNRSRLQMLVKLAMTASVSRTGNIQEGITQGDVTRALGWLLQAESRMEDIFRSMQGKSDSAIIEELHYFVATQWNRNGKEGVSDAIINKFLMTRVPSEKISKVIDIAARSEMIVKVPGSDHWLPRAKPMVGLY